MTETITLPPATLEAIAHNVCSLHGFDPAFVIGQERFALAVITEYERDRRVHAAGHAYPEEPGVVFDLLETVSDQIERLGDKARADNIRAGFARGTGGVSVEYLAPLLAASTEEIAFWREEAAASMEHLAIQLKAQPDDPLPDYMADPWRRLRSLHVMLSDAMEGRTSHETCECCGEPVRVGQPTISSNVGEIHATCMGATAEQIAAGSMPCKVEDIDFENIDDERAEAMRADPRLGIHIHGPLYPLKAMRAVVEKAGELLAARAATEAKADAAEEGEAQGC